MSHPQMEAKQNHNLNLYEGKAYTLVGNIMLTAIIILFFVVILLLFLHLYPRWYLRWVRRRNRHHRRTPLVFYVDSFPSDVLSCGLDASVLRSLPVFLYSSNNPPHSEPVQCAVCLSEFKENEAGRVLPKCNHSFHVECIDMWFQSHSTCPLCRTLVEPLTASEMVINVCEPARPEQGSSSGLSADCQSNGQEENRIDQTLSSSSSSIELKRKPSSLVGGTIELPMTRSFGRGADVSGCGSPSTQSSFRSSMSRILSFKRILSREKKENFSPSSVGAVGCSSTTELDTERRGRDETQGS